jgi:hypothetical protein
MVGGGHFAIIRVGPLRREPKVDARRARTPDRTAKLTPNVVDGARGAAFIEAAVRSNQKDGAWTSARFG